MAINKKLIHFKNKEAFDRELQAGNILETSICFVPDAKFIYTRGSYWYCPYSKEEIDQMIADSSELTINTINLQLTLLQTDLEELINTKANSADLENYLPLSGGTLTDNVTFKPEAGNEGDLGDAVLYDKTNDKLIIVPTTDNIGTLYPADTYEPIGVVVIPSSHDVYGTGDCGIMSLKTMSCDTPSTGISVITSNPYMIWGEDSNSLPSLNLIPIGNTSDGIPARSISSGSSYLPSDTFDKEQCIHDTNTYYSINGSGTSANINGAPLIPSPYLTDGSRNPGYSQVSAPLSSANALADFDGRENTDVIIAQRGEKDYTSWKPTYNKAEDYPAASCCDMFYTNGTKQGDWYLPAMGELGYVMARLGVINESISKLISAYGDSCGISISIGQQYSPWYWTSSRYSVKEYYMLVTNQGILARVSSSYTQTFARAFLRFNRQKGIIIPGKTSKDLLNAIGGTTNISYIVDNLLLTRNDLATTKDDLATTKDDLATTKDDLVGIENGLEKKLPLSGGIVTGDITFKLPIFKSKANVGDSVLYDKVNNDLIIVSTTDDMGTQYPADNYEPIGVVAIPSSHDVYGTGGCGVISLKDMSCTSPDTGSTSYLYSCFGQESTDLGLPKLDHAPIGNTSDGIPTSQITITTSLSTAVYLPSDEFSEVVCAHDSNAYYYSGSAPYDKFVPSPYLSNGERNPGYYQITSPLSPSNIFSDFNGRRNSQVLWDRATEQSNWKTAKIITNNYELGYSPAACCCWRYHTNGTSLGDWYLPAMGELGYVAARLKTINETISKLISVYGDSCGLPINNTNQFGYSSSSGYGTGYLFEMRPDWGQVTITSRRFKNSIRAFTCINPSKGIIISSKTSNDLLNAAGGTISIDELKSQVAPDLSTYATKEELGNYIQDIAESEGFFSGYVVAKGHGFLMKNEDIPVDGNIAGIYDGVTGISGGKTPIVIGRVSLGTNGLVAYKGGLEIDKSSNSVYFKEFMDDTTYGANVFRITRDGIQLYQVSDETNLLNAGGSTTSISDLVSQVTAAIVDGAPTTLDTLNELAAALGDDPNFATTITNQIAGKAPMTHTHEIGDITDLQTLLDSKLDTLVSGTSIKTVNGSSLLGSGDISVLTKSENGTNIYISNYLETITDVPFGGYKVTPSNTNDSGGFTAGITMGTSGQDAGFMTIYTTDNGTEPIYAAQYDWNGSSEVGIAHYITLMDSSGNQIFNQVTANGYYVADKTSNDLLNAAGGTVSIDSIATVKSASGTKTIWTGTQSEYEAIDTKDANTLYFITEE